MVQNGGANDEIELAIFKNQFFGVELHHPNVALTVFRNQLALQHT